MRQQRRKRDNGYLVFLVSGVTGVNIETPVHLSTVKATCYVITDVMSRCNVFDGKFDIISQFAYSFQQSKKHDAIMHVYS